MKYGLTLREYKLLTGNLIVTSASKLRELELLGYVTDIEQARGKRNGWLKLYTYNVTAEGYAMAEAERDSK
jgi:hypothetical protein